MNIIRYGILAAAFLSGIILIGPSMHLNRHGYNNCKLSIGGVPGGRPKK